MNIFKRFRAVLRIKEAARQADKAHKKTGERYYVIPNGKNGKLIIMDRFNFRKLKQKRYVSHNVFVNDLERECFYCTPYRNGNGALSKEVVTMKCRHYIEFVAKNSKRNNGK